MELFIPDLYEVLKCRVKKLTSPKESDQPEDILIRLNFLFDYLFLQPIEPNETDFLFPY